MAEPARPIPAATVIIMDQTEAQPHFLVVRRNPQVPVQGNIWVFPGGRLAAVDCHPPDTGDALRACAVRETEEEAGLQLDPARLIRLVQWVTPLAVTHRFDTRFFLIPLAHRPAVKVDGHEIVQYQWLPAAAALAQHHARQIELSPPGYVLLSWMQRLKSAAEITGHFRKAPLRHIQPHWVPLEDGGCNLFAEDVAYQSGDLETAGPQHRLWMRKSGWRYEGNPFGS